MSRRGRRIIAVGVAVLASAAVIAPIADAEAANRRVSISDYQWSDPGVQLDLGEHVTWYWVGPDTMHSITGIAPEATGLDSDPQTNQPQHKIGDTFRLDFDQPGTYNFKCKLHSTVRGTVSVSATPGDPESEPDPVPQSKVDLKAPKLRELRLDRTGIRRKGTPMRFSINEAARIEADIYEIKRGGKRRFSGYAKWRGTHVGYNKVRFGTRRKHFKARPGRYIAKVQAIDSAANAGKLQTIKFKILRRRR